MLKRTSFFRAVTISQFGKPVADTKPILEHLDVSKSAWQRLAYINQRDNKPDRWLRLLIGSGGCQGFTYEFIMAQPSSEKAEKFDDDIEFVNDSAVPDACEGDFGDGTDLDSEKEKSSSSSSSSSVPPVKFFIDEVSLKKLSDANIAFVANTKGMGFFVDGNKNVDKSCACGQSFSMKK